MKKSIYILILILSLFFISCREDEPIVKKVEIFNYEEIKVVEYNNYKLSDFDLKVTYEDGSFKIIRLEANMMSEDDLKKFTQIGSHKVYISYKGAHTAFEFEVKELNENIAGLKVILSNTEYTYTGMAICPSVSVLDGTDQLINGIDYTVEYFDNINAGIGVAQIKGIGKYEGIYNSIFTINKADLVVKANDVLIEGGGLPEFTVSYEGFKYVDNEDSLAGSLIFDCKYESDINGTYDIIPSGLTSHNYNIEFEKGILTINRLPLKDSNVTLSNIVFNYTGLEIEPAVIVTVNDKTYNDENYRVEYYNNIDSGTAKVVVTGRNALSGTVEKTFTINKALLEISVNNEEIYYLDETPKFNVLYKGFVGDDSVYSLNGELTISCDYDGKVVGEYPIKVSGLSSDNYEITYKDGLLKVKEAEIDKLNIDIVTTVYAGIEVVPTYSVYKGEYKLQADEFEISITDNINVGTANVTVKGINNFTGTLTKTFTITKANLEIIVNDLTCEYGSDVLNSETPYTYKVNGLVNGETLANLGGNLVLSSNFKGNVGTYDIVASGLTSNNYNITYKKGLLTVSEKEVLSNNVKLNETVYTYNGSSITPQYEISVDSLVITKNDYTYEYTNNIDAGTGKLTLVFKGNYKGTVVKEFTINKAKLTVTPKSYEVIFGDKAPVYESSVKGFVGKDNLSSLSGELAYNCSYNNLSNVGKYDITLSGLSSNNYEITYEKAEVVVKEKSIEDGSIELVSGDNYVFTGKEITPVIKVTVGDKELTLSQDYKVEYLNNINSGKASIKVIGINNYLGVINSEYVINKCDIEIKVNDSNINYLEDLSKFDVSFSNLPDALSQDAIKETLKYSCDYVKGNIPGTYEISVSGYESENLNITYVKGSLNVLVDNEFSGEGTKENPYKISSLHELYGLSLEVRNGKNFESCYFVLTNDIDFGGYSLETIGETKNPFSGNFNGNGYRIKNAKMISSSPYTIGLFGEINNAHISNIIVDSISFDGSIKQTNIGVIAKANNSVIDSVVVSDINMNITPMYNLTIGGLVGVLNNSSISNSYITGSIVINESAVDSICGAVGEVYNSSVDSIYTNLHINIHTNEVTTGGLVGKASSSQISNSFVLGELDVDGYICEVKEIVCEVADSYVLIDNVLYSSEFNINYGNEYINKGTDELIIINAMKKVWDLNKWLFIIDEYPVLRFEQTLNYVNKVDSLEMEYGNVYLDHFGFIINPKGQDVLKPGTYEVELNLKEGFVWTDNTTESVQVLLNVLKKDLYINIDSHIINPMEEVNVTYTYKGLLDSDASLLNNLVFVHGYTGEAGTYEINLSNVLDNYNVILSKGYIYVVNETNKWSIWDGSYSDIEFLGSGTEEDPYQINSANDLASLAYKANNGMDTKYHYVLNTNIDLNNINFPGIGNVMFEKTFNGVFNGNGYVITNLYISVSDSNCYGLFGHIKNGKVLNLDVTNANVVGSSYDEIYVGVIAGFVDNSEISSSSASGYIDIEYHGYQSLTIGGLASYVMNNSKINNVFTDISINVNIINNQVSNKPTATIGGLAGFIYDSSIEYGYTKGSINVDSNDDFINVAGIAGFGSGESIKAIYSKVNLYITGNSSLVKSNATLCYTFDSISDIIYSDNVCKVIDGENTIEVLEHVGTKMSNEELSLFIGTNFDSLVWDLTDLENPKLIK